MPHTPAAISADAPTIGSRPTTVALNQSADAAAPTAIRADSATSFGW
jgi:hypothetical protein